MTPRVVGYTPDAYKTRQGFVEITIGGIRLGQIAHNTNAGGSRTWLSFPRVRRPDHETGESIAHDVFQFDDEHARSEFEQALLVEIERYLDEAVGSGKARGWR